MSQWGETRILCAWCDKGQVATAGDVCSDCVRDGLEAVDVYLGKYAAFSDWEREQRKAPPKRG